MPTIINWTKEIPEKEGYYLVKFLWRNGGSVWNYDLLFVLSDEYYSSGSFYETIQDYLKELCKDNIIIDSIEYGYINDSNNNPQ